MEFDGPAQGCQHPSHGEAVIPPAQFLYPGGERHVVTDLLLPYRLQPLLAGFGECGPGREPTWSY